jgi:WD40 repeat protein
MAALGNRARAWADAAAHALQADGTAGSNGQIAASDGVPGSPWAASPSVHTSFVYAVCVAGGGSSGRPLRVITGGADNSARVWRAASFVGKPEEDPEGPDSYTQEWPAEPEHTLTGHADSVNGLAATADRVISGADDNTAIVWDLDTGERLAHLTGHTHWIWGVCIRPDPSQLLGAMVLEQPGTISGIEARFQLASAMDQSTACLVTGGGGDNRLMLWNWCAFGPAFLLGALRLLTFCLFVCFVL